MVRQFGRAALVEETEFGAFLGLRLRERHGSAVQVELTRPLNEFGDVPGPVRTAAQAYAAREHRNTPYGKFAVGTEHPSPGAMKDAEL